MNVTISSEPSRHVHWASHDDVRIIPPVVSAADVMDDGSSIQSLRFEASRLEMSIRAIPPGPPRVPEQEPPATIGRRVSNAMHRLSLVVGMCALPTFILAVISPIFLAIPAGMLFLALVISMVAGRPSPEIEQARQQRAIENQHNIMSTP